jgi:hypothetical protein
MNRERCDVGKTLPLVWECVRHFHNLGFRATIGKNVSLLGDVYFQKTNNAQI